MSNGHKAGGAAAFRIPVPLVTPNMRNPKVISWDPVVCTEDTLKQGREAARQVLGEMGGYPHTQASADLIAMALAALHNPQAVQSQQAVQERDDINRLAHRRLVLLEAIQAADYKIDSDLAARIDEALKQGTLWPDKA